MPRLALMKSLGKRIICLLLAGMLFSAGCAGRLDKGEVTPLTVKRDENVCLEAAGAHLDEGEFRAVLDQALRDNDLPGLVDARPDAVVIRVKEEEFFEVSCRPLSGDTLLRPYEVAKGFMDLDLSGFSGLRGGFGSGSLSGGGGRSYGGDSILDTPVRGVIAVALGLTGGTVLMVRDFFPQPTWSMRASVSIGRGEAPGEEKILLVNSGKMEREKALPILYEKLAERICEALEIEPPAS